MKIVKWAALALVVLLVVGGLIFYFSLNSIVRSTVEKQTQSQLKVDTTLGGANVSLFGGSLSLSDFSLGSPTGFSAARMFQLGSASVAVSYGQLRSDPIRIQDITIRRPVLTVEQANGQFNFKALMGQMTPRPQQQEPTHLVISKLTIADPSVVLRPGIPGLAQEVVIPLSTITMENVGSGPDAQNGAAIQDVVMAIITRMADQAANSDKLPEQLKGLLKLDTKQMAAAIGGAVGTEMTKIEKGLEQQLGAPATQVIGDVLKQTTGQPDAGKAVQKGLEDLLGGDRKDRKKERAPTTQP